MDAYQVPPTGMACVLLGSVARGVHGEMCCSGSIRKGVECPLMGKILSSYELVWTQRGTHPSKKVVKRWIFKPLLSFVLKPANPKPAFFLFVSAYVPNKWGFGVSRLAWFASFW